MITSSQVAVPLVAFTRPTFPSVESFIASYEHALSMGRKPWPARTREETIALVEQYPAMCLRYIPQPDEMELLGLRRDYGRRPVQPFDQEFREEFYETLKADPDWARAIGLLLREASW